MQGDIYGLAICNNGLWKEVFSFYNPFLFGKYMRFKEEIGMSEIKIAEKVIIDEPQNVEIAIKNLTGKRVDFEIIRKFILNEK